MNTGVTNFSVFQSEFLIMTLLILNLITNAGDQQIINVVVHENVCFSERAAAALLLRLKSSLAGSRFPLDYNCDLTLGLAPDATKSLIRF